MVQRHGTERLLEAGSIGEQSDDVVAGDAGGEVLRETSITIAFREASAVTIPDQRKMPPSCVTIAFHRSRQNSLSGCAREKILAPNHVRDSMSQIIDDDRELIRRTPVPRPDDRIADLAARIEGSIAEDSVVDRLVATRHRETMSMFRTVETPVRLVGGSKLGRESQLAASVGRVQGVADVASTEGRSVHLSGLREDVHRPEVGLQIVRLPDGPAVPVESESAHRTLDEVDAFRAGPLHIEILVSEEDGPAEIPRETPIEQKGADVPQVQIAGRTRCETCRSCFDRVLKVVHAMYSAASHAAWRIRIPEGS